ncbi:response regulator [Vibrio cholerae]
MDQMSENTPLSILIVDDTSSTLSLLSDLLIDDYELFAATNGYEALRLCEEQKPDLILLDVMMPDIDGFTVCKNLKANPNTQHIPVIFITAKNNPVDEEVGLSIGAVDYIQKPFSAPIVKARVKTHLQILNQRKHLQDIVDEQIFLLRQTQLKIINRLARAAEYKDNETGLHVVRMSHYSYAIAKHYGCDLPWCELLQFAAPMHDVGKIGICDSILLKPGILTDDERKEMEKHCEIGEDILGDDSSPLLNLAKEVALSHHERWDGKGYPHKLKGSSIPLSAQIVSVADVFDALTSVRPYKQAWPVQDALDYIQEHKGSQFSPQVVEAFINAVSDILTIKETYPN